MSYPRVNLLKKSEQRYQGAVSRRFITISIVVTPILFVALLSGIKLVQYTGVQSDLKASREIWINLEPKLALFNEENRSLAANRQILALFDGWRDSQLPIVELMDEVQDAVPANVQFTRFMLRSKVEPGTYLSPEEMQLRFALQIDGISQGERAEEEVWKFHKDLLATVGIAKEFEVVELSGMRKRQNADGRSEREFKIVGANEEGGEQ
jgi:hypothetical protein